MERLNESYEQYEGDYINIGLDDDDCLEGLRERIRALPLPERKIFLMWVELGTYSEVAKILHCSVPTVSSKIRAILEKLKIDIDSICRDY